MYECIYNSVAGNKFASEINIFLRSSSPDPLAPPISMLSRRRRVRLDGIGGMIVWTKEVLDMFIV